MNGESLFNNNAKIKQLRKAIELYSSTSEYHVIVIAKDQTIIVVGDGYNKFNK
jgi:hypothetical protein